MQEAIFLKPVIDCNGQGPLCLWSILYLNPAEVGKYFGNSFTLYKGVNTHEVLRVKPQRCTRRILTFPSLGLSFSDHTHHPQYEQLDM